jgi:Domain of unknown function (DUF4383)/Short repeat of unknown function (DUF308)
MAFRRSHRRDDVVEPAYRGPDEPVIVRDEAYEAVDDRPAVGAAAPPFSPAQLVALVVGIGFTVLGIAAVAQTGFDTDHIYTPVERVWSLSHSPLLGLIEIGFGVLMIAAAVVPGGARELMGLLGACALAFGIVTLVDAAQDDLHGWLGVTDRSGWFYIIVGAVTLVAALLSPVFFPTTRRERVASVRRSAY